MCSHYAYEYVIRTGVEQAGIFSALYNGCAPGDSQTCGGNSRFCCLCIGLADPQVTHTESKLGPARSPSGLRMLKNVVCL